MPLRSRRGYKQALAEASFLFQHDFRHGCGLILASGTCVALASAQGFHSLAASQALRVSSDYLGGEFEDLQFLKVDC